MFKKDHKLLFRIAVVLAFLSLGMFTAIGVRIPITNIETKSLVVTNTVYSTRTYLSTYLKTITSITTKTVVSRSTYQILVPAKRFITTKVKQEQNWIDEHALRIHAGRWKVYHSDFKPGTKLRIIITVISGGERDVNFYIFDRYGYSIWEATPYPANVAAGTQYSLESRVRVSKVDMIWEVPRTGLFGGPLTGRIFFVIDNTFSVITAKTVNVKISLIKEEENILTKTTLSPVKTYREVTSTRQGMVTYFTPVTITLTSYVPVNVVYTTYWTLTRQEYLYLPLPSELMTVATAFLLIAISIACIISIGRIFKSRKIVEFKPRPTTLTRRPAKPPTAKPFKKAAAQLSVQTCPNCGAVVWPGDKYCPQCGVRLKIERRQLPRPKLSMDEILALFPEYVKPLLKACMLLSLLALGAFTLLTYGGSFAFTNLLVMLMVILSSVILVVYGGRAAQLAALKGYRRKEKIIRNVCYLIAELLILFHLSRYLVYASLIPAGGMLTLFWLLAILILVALHSYKILR